jgi:hypothetical protein
MKSPLPAVLLAMLGLPTQAASPQGAVHGLWVWKSESVLEAPEGAQALRAFCKSAGVSEIYLSFPPRVDRGAEMQFARLVSMLHDSGVRTEALISSTNGDESGAPRAKLLGRVRSVLEFNDRHPAQRFDGIHLDIEPQQRPENKGAGNLGFLSGLAAAYHDVAGLTAPARLTLNADVQIKLLKGDLQQRRMLLTSIPRLTLMLYELSSPDDGTTTQEKEQKLRDRNQAILDQAYQGLGGDGLAKMAIALRTPDYGPLLPQMLALLDEMNRGNDHYLGWARHSYNDVLVSSAAP